MKGKLPLVVVKWADAWTKEEGVTLEDVRSHHAPTLVTTIGWLLLQDGEGVSLANEVYDDTYRGRTFIPAGMIKSVTHFKLSKERKSHVPHSPAKPSPPIPLP